MKARTDSYARTLPAQQDWTRAACKDMQLDLWFYPSTDEDWLPEWVKDADGKLVSRTKHTRVQWDDEPGKQVCRRCPISVECFDYAQSNGIEYGTWGGFNQHERLQMRGGGRWRDKDRCLQPRCGRVATVAGWCRAHEGMVA